MNILHITGVRLLTNGQRQQLIAEINAVKNLPEHQWKVVAIHSGHIMHPFENSFPKIFSPLFLRSLYCWIYILKNANKYDCILFRHITFDPFVLIFGWFVKNRVTIHHAKEIEELKLIKKGWKGVLASTFERLTGKVSANQVRAIVGVTPEIADYVCEVHKVNKPKLFYPNGIDVQNIEMLSDNRDENINAAFICGTFSSWHGLEELIESTRGYIGQEKINIHLIGSLTEKQLQLLDVCQDSNLRYISHGFLEPNEYRAILDRCDFGIGSIALCKKGLEEAVTLKVREYLAMGLPVIASHKDAALPEDFPYFLNVPVKEILKVSLDLKKKNYSREVVRCSAREYIEKKRWIEDLLSKLLVLSQPSLR